jgi:hypothetical protein
MKDLHKVRSNEKEMPFVYVEQLPSEMPTNKESSFHRELISNMFLPHIQTEMKYVTCIDLS